MVHRLVLVWAALCALLLSASAEMTASTGPHGIPVVVRAGPARPDPRCGPIVPPRLSNVTLWQSNPKRHALAFSSDNMILLANPGADGVLIIDGAVYSFHAPLSLDVSVCWKWGLSCRV